jgi:lipopolysaccharide export LptBFGC system permease protein LptF
MIDSKFFKFLKIDGLLDSVKGYIDARIQLFKLELQEKAANVITIVIFIIMVIFCGLMTLAFLSIALGNFLNEQFGNTYLGFCVLGLFYLIMLIILGVNISKGVLHRKVQSSIKKSFGKPGKKE